MVSAMLRGALAGLLALSLAAAGHAADDPQHEAALAEHYRLGMPAGAAPFPAVLLVSGCSGFEVGFSKPHYDGVQQRLAAAGFVTVRVDSLAARGAASCLAVPHEWVAGDIAIAHRHLSRQPFVKPGAINLMGWSAGGASALRALGRSEARAPVRVAAVVAYYPACQYATPWEAPVPVLVLAGAIDNVAPVSVCEELFSGLPDSARVTLRVYDSARHGFDIAQLPAELKYGFGTLGYNEAAARAAWAEVLAFLRR